MRKNSGTSLVELLVSLIVTSILILTIGVLSTISNTSYKKALTAADLYSEIAFGLKMIQNRIHKATTPITQPLAQASPWVSNRLIVDNEAFGLYDNSSSWDFVHLPNKTNATTREVMFSVPKSNPTPSLSFTVTGNSIVVSLSGKKNNVPFSFASKIIRRSS